MKKTQQLVSQVCVNTRARRIVGQEMSGLTVASTSSSLHVSHLCAFCWGSAWIHNRCRANRTNTHPLPNLTFTYQLSSPPKAARPLSLHPCLLNPLVRTLMSHYGRPSSCLLTITDDETDSGPAVTDNGVQGSFRLWLPAALFAQALGSLCRAVHLFLPLS